MSWNNGMRYMSLYILMKTEATNLFLDHVGNQESDNLYLQHNKTKQNKKHNNVDQQKMRYFKRIRNIHTAGLSENVSLFPISYKILQKY